MSGFQSKREAAVDKLQEPVCDKDPQGCWNVRCQLGKQCKNLAQPAQEPDALTIAYQSGFYDGKKAAQRPWVGLTEKDFSAINQSCLTKLQAATSAESILKEKNS